MINNAEQIGFNELINTAFKAGLGYSALRIVERVDMDEVNRDLEYQSETVR